MTSVEPGPDPATADGGATATVVYLPPADGDTTAYAPLDRRLGGAGVVLPVRADRGALARPRSIGDLVAAHRDDLAARVRGGAVVPVGHGSGAVLALELARSLRDAGWVVPAVVMLDPGFLHPSPAARDGLGGPRGAALRAGRDALQLRRRHVAAAGPHRAGAPTDEALRREVRLHDAAAALRAHLVQPYDGAVVFVRAAGSPVSSLGRWRERCRGPFTVTVVPGTHDGPDGLLVAHAAEVAAALAPVLHGVGRS